MSAEGRIPPNVLVADFASGQGGPSCTVQWSDRPWQARRGGGRCCPEWSLLVSALICKLSCSSICVLCTSVFVYCRISYVYQGESVLAQMVTLL